MNERIRELAEQAGWSDDKHFASWNKIHQWQNFDKEKFAELIVRECANFLDENSGYDDSNNAWHPEPEELLQHFGVK